MHKSRDECVMDFSEDDRPSLKNIIKTTCKKFGVKDKAVCAVIYNKSGIKMFDDDANFIRPADVLYIALDGKLYNFHCLLLFSFLAVNLLLGSSRLCFTGESFNYCAILDDYDMSEKLGEGGFGAVYLATNKVT